MCQAEEISGKKHNNYVSLSYIKCQISVSCHAN